MQEGEEREGSQRLHEILKTFPDLGLLFIYFISAYFCLLFICPGQCQNVQELYMSFIGFVTPTEVSKSHDVSIDNGVIYCPILLQMAAQMTILAVLIVKVADPLFTRRIKLKIIATKQNKSVLLQYYFFLNVFNVLPVQKAP